jgi:hypothetical protein
MDPKKNINSARVTGLENYGLTPIRQQPLLSQLGLFVETVLVDETGKRHDVVVIAVPDGDDSSQAQMATTMSSKHLQQLLRLLADAVEEHSRDNATSNN